MEREQDGQGTTNTDQSENDRKVSKKHRDENGESVEHDGQGKRGKTQGLVTRGTALSPGRGEGKGAE